LALGQSRIDILGSRSPHPCNDLLIHSSQSHVDPSHAKSASKFQPTPSRTTAACQTTKPPGKTSSRYFISSPSSRPCVGSLPTRHHPCADFTPLLSSTAPSSPLVASAGVVCNVVSHGQTRQWPLVGPNFFSYSQALFRYICIHFNSYVLEWNGI
jgi:hypothetical protein